MSFFFFFFFQAEDGIRDYKVTGVQTCALPIAALLALSSVGCGEGAPGRGPPPKPRGRGFGAGASDSTCARIVAGTESTSARASRYAAFVAAAGVYISRGGAASWCSPDAGLFT